MTLKTGDSGIATTPTSRLAVFATGMVASVAATDYGSNTNTAARPDVCNPAPVLFTNPPEAASDPGSA